MKVKFATLLLFIASLFWFAEYTDSLEYGISANHRHSVPITKLFVISERCSGSNYINSLLLQNFPLKEEHLGHKHFPPWYQWPIEKYFGNPQYYTFEGTEDFLFIVIFRNPYDWVRSFHMSPWHAHPSLRKIPFAQFIRSPWLIDPQDKTMVRQQSLHPGLDLNPFDELPFQNVFALRTEKIKTMLTIKERAANVYFINYEVVRDHPQEVLREIGDLFLLQKNAEYSPVIYKKGKPAEGEYKATQYPFLSVEDLLYINAQLNPEVEEAIGYPLLFDPFWIEAVYAPSLSK